VRHVLGLHTVDEQGEALGLVMKAHGRGVDAARAQDRCALTFEIGFIHAILELARLEGAGTLAQTAQRKRDDLDRRAMELT